MTEQRPSGPLYQWVSDDIEGKVRSGKLAAGDRLPSEHALCDIYGVSQITVRRALRELRHSGVVVSRHGLGWFISDHPQADSVAGTVSLVVPGHLESLPFGLLQAMLYGLEGARYRVVVTSLDGDWDGAQEALFAAAAQKHAAAFMFVQGDSAGLSARLSPVIEESPLPVVMALREIDGVETHAIVLDEDVCAASVTRHLISLGHRRIAYVGADPTTVDGDRRYWGFANTLWDNNAEVSLDWVVTGQVGSTTFMHRLEALFTAENGPTAVFCSHDIYALQVISALANVGRSCPRDVAVVGMGDEPVCSAAPTPITTIRFDLDALAHAAVGQLRDIQIGQELKVAHVGGRVIQRQSCGSSMPARMYR